MPPLKEPKVRTTICLSADLKRRMDAAALRVNWSATAAEAFEATLAALVTEKEDKATAMQLISTPAGTVCWASM